MAKERCRTMLLRFWRDESGATVVEYGIIVAVLSMTIIASVAMVAGEIETLFADPAGKLQQTLD
ncbi:Flp family type IVb pilin [Nitratireductor sp. CAU 1489]|uniref:Flp family type IVb pilin n=2 Tax=Nitratireductor arenosus TaxID=2682096 RepID=A0A844QC26_9HYPH|nr:Flp family type IVb pilin [Nitratireductor arenosus]